MNDSSPLVIGVDYGTASVRSLIVNAHSGEEMATSVFEYPRWKARKYVDDNKNQPTKLAIDELLRIIKLTIVVRLVITCPN